MGNYPDTKIGEKIFLMGLAELSGYSEKEISQGRTPRNYIHVEDCLIDDITFVSKEFQSVLSQYKKMVITNTKNEDETISCVFDGVKYDFGFGGLHALRAPGIYHNLCDADVSSYYPNLAISNNFSPQHLGDNFCKVYKNLYDERKQYPKGSPESEALKLALNGTFGASNAPWSPFYDPLFTMRITICGQLILTMLCERLTLLRAAKIVMANTDGISVEILDRAKFDKVNGIPGVVKSALAVFLANRFDVANADDCNNYACFLVCLHLHAEGAGENL